MAEDKKPKQARGITPKGIAVWPHLIDPDEYQGARTYKTGLILEDCDKLIEQIEEEAEKAYQAAKDELTEKAKSGKSGQDKAKAKKALEALTKGVPYAPHVDEDGNEIDGSHLFKFKSNSEFKDKKGNVRPITIPIFDCAKPKPQVIKPKAIWGGSVIRIAYVVVPYYVASANQAGVSLRIEGVQVIELNAGGGGTDAARYGFEGDDEGYVGDDEDTSEDSPSADTDDGDEADDGSSDF